MNKYYYILVALLLVSCTGNQSKKKATTPEKHGFSNEKNEKLVSPSQYEQNNVAAENCEMISFDGSSFLMGSDAGLPQERPIHEVTVKPFSIDKSPVTVAQFKVFIESTGYKTEAEKFGDSGVFNLENKNWELMKGAFWKKPFGPNGPNAQDNHPVTHVSWNDARAYAKWAEKRLPTEAEWEYAARSGKNSGEKFSWGNELTKNGEYFANTWQGSIDKPETKDGFLYTCPVGTFGENEAGLTDMGGNVWQWCSDNYKAYPGSSAPIHEDANVKTIRGGSFFYDQYGGDSFSVSGRSGNSHETSLFNTGFRCAKDLN
uniref:formylglycine-generating enzyme family protein n=1 Tax=uncultured Draconibacterium sp. TaxID=1573823 RepID=UPI00321648BD